MMKHNPAQRGFTIIELLIVLVIVGILASIAAPIMRGNIDKAKKLEAVAALGTIRTAERLYFAEKSYYTAVGASTWAGDNHNLNGYIKDGDLNGRYYNQINYSVALNGNNQHFNSVAINTTLGNVWMNETGGLNGY